jgi:hypothetical protein
VHGLRGHPKETWEGTKGNEENQDNKKMSQKKKRSWFFPSKVQEVETRQDENATLDEERDEKSNKVFWPEEFLLEDIPQARILTYGYNADVIGGLFQAGNMNSISQHGRDLSVKLERSLNNEVLCPDQAFVAGRMGQKI